MFESACQGGNQPLLLYPNMSPSIGTTLEIFSGQLALRYNLLFMGEALSEILKHRYIYLNFYF